MLLFDAEMGNDPASNSTLLDCVCEGKEKLWLIAHSRHCVVSYICHITYSANMLCQPHPQLCPSSGRYEVRSTPVDMIDLHSRLVDRSS